MIKVMLGQSRVDAVNHEFLRLAARMLLRRDWENEAIYYHLGLLAQGRSPLEIFFTLARHALENPKEDRYFSRLSLLVRYMYCRAKAYAKTVLWTHRLLYWPYQGLRKIYRGIRWCYECIPFYLRQPLPSKYRKTGQGLQVSSQHIQGQVANVYLEEKVNFLANRIRDLCQHAEKEVYFFHVEDFIFSVPRDAWRIVALMQRSNFYKSETIQWMRQFVQPGMIVLDIGANIGQHTVLVAQVLKGRGKIHAFEPSPRIYSVLLENIQINGFSALPSLIETHCLCVTHELGVVRLHDQYKNTFLSPATSLDTFFDPNTPVDLIKMSIKKDLEIALQGMRRVLADNPKVRVLMEYSLPQKQAVLDFFAGWRVNQINAENILIYREDESVA